MVNRNHRHRKLSALRIESKLAYGVKHRGPGCLPGEIKDLVRCGLVSRDWDLDMLAAWHFTVRPFTRWFEAPVLTRRRFAAIAATDLATLHPDSGSATIAGVESTPRRIPAGN